MGSKLAVKDVVKVYDIFMVFGLDYVIMDIDEVKKVVKEIGFFVLIKAFVGGGGKGMWIVENLDEFEDQMKWAISEVIFVFGDGLVFVEKYVILFCYIEIQVLADEYGNYIYFFEWECSIQCCY